MLNFRLGLLSLITCFIVTAAGAQENTLSKGDLTLRYSTEVPEEAAEALLARAESGFAIVRAFLAQAETYSGEPYDTPIEIIIDPEQYAPFQRGSTIRLPQDRVMNIYNNSEDGRIDIGLIHEITHVLAASFNRANRDRFYDDGLAVYLQHRFGLVPNYPNFGEDLYVATVKLASERGGYLPLSTTEATRRNAQTRVDRTLAYLQEGAFTLFLIENYGLNAYFRVYHGEDLKAVTGKSLAELESDWLHLLNQL